MAGDFRVVINSLLCQDRDLAPYFLPIDFAGTREAERRNIRTKQLAGDALNDGIPLILFPSGTVSTATHRGFGPVKDTHWTTFAAKTGAALSTHYCAGILSWSEQPRFPHRFTYRGTPAHGHAYA